MKNKLAVSVSQNPFRLNLPRMGSMVKKARRHRDAMGETGEGISSRDEIDMSRNNVFMNKWGTYYILVV